jgi:2,3-bisphosphoglycerate-independent phosphoglycerate mutase
MDSIEEDGDFDRKVQAIEAVDQLMSSGMELDPDILVVADEEKTGQNRVGRVGA